MHAQDPTGAGAAGAGADDSAKKDWPVVETDTDVHVWTEGTTETVKTCTTTIRKIQPGQQQAAGN